MRSEFVLRSRAICIPALQRKGTNREAPKQDPAVSTGSFSSSVISQGTEESMTSHNWVQGRRRLQDSSSHISMYRSIEISVSDIIASLWSQSPSLHWRWRLSHPLLGHAGPAPSWIERGVGFLAELSEAFSAAFEIEWTLKRPSAHCKNHSTSLQTAS